MPADAVPASQRLLSTRFDDLDLEQTLAALQARDPAARFAYVVTPNADHFLRLERSGPELKRIYDAAWLSVCDSRVLRALAARRGIRLKLAAGSDLAVQLFARAIRADTPVTVIGGTEAVAADLRARFGLRHLAHHNPPMGFIRDPAEVARCVDFVAENPAPYVFLCVGSPRQEELAAAIVASGRATGIGLCLGAALEFVTGEKKRAPGWMQQANLEWLHRLASEPRRLWRRYILEAPRLLWMMRKVKRPQGTPPSRNG
ncbi:WecB/TagA/CpsF family glycosyltransferase [Roseomonas sp. 18066]|uniref:WecB/TagA/CpsF family glycosyltransferase n=1 Tax=Roseomonas sp. 18066 TaxID=2681412 RepID=UPI0013579DB7|nr:WecB/TagA/CpsF family glycosyltransferase [Roseomonas sp. 18066]